MEKYIETYLEKIDQVIANGRYKDTWESLQQYHAPAWYEQVKFGIFIHWGVYSVPAFGNEWYSRTMYIQGSREYEHHRKTYGDHRNFGYKDFIPMFQAERFAPEEWIRLFKEAGVQYVIPVAEHHDGFQMYDSQISRWNAKVMGPERDVFGELTRECEKAGLINGGSSHRVEHWFFMGPGKTFDSDIKDPLNPGDLYWPSMPEGDFSDIYSEPAPSQEFMEDWLCRSCELIDKYRPKILYFDWWIQHCAVKPYLRKFAAYYYNRADEWGEEVVINYKHDAFCFGTAVPDVERGQFAEAKPYVWQSDSAVARNSWCYTEHNDYKVSREIVCDLMDIVSKNGRLLLNIGPKADGTIPDEDRRILLEIGEWLKVNGQAVYGAKVWRKSAEGPTQIVEGQFTDGTAKEFTSEDMRFTVNGDSVYVTCLNMKGKDQICVRSLAKSADTAKPDFCGSIKDVQVLGYDGHPQWEQDEKGLHIRTVRIDCEMPVVFQVVMN